MKVRIPCLIVVFWAAVASAAMASGAGDDHRGLPTSAVAQEFQELTPAEVQARMQRAEIVVLDASPTDAFAKHHVPEAKWVDCNHVSEQDLPSDKSAAIVFYCMNELCRASHMAAHRARWLGWTRIYVMPKGIEGWIEAGLATVVQ